MTAKERVLTTISHEEPDRVPVGEWQYGKEIIDPVLGKDTLFHCGLRTIKAYWEGRRDEVVDQWKKGLIRLTEHVRWDAVLLHLVIDKHTAIDVPEQISEESWRDAWGNILTYSPEQNMRTLSRC